MAHIVIDFSPGLEHELDMAAFCNHMREAAVATGILPMPGVRVRAIRADFASIADGDPQHGYIDISLRLRGGRSAEAKKAATAHIFREAETFLSDLMAKRSLALSFEMRDIDPDLSPKTGTIRKFLEES